MTDVDPISREDPIESQRRVAPATGTRDEPDSTRPMADATGCRGATGVVGAVGVEHWLTEIAAAATNSASAEMWLFPGMTWSKCTTDAEHSATLRHASGLEDQAEARQAAIGLGEFRNVHRLHVRKTLANARDRPA